MAKAEPKLFRKDPRSPEDVRDAVSKDWFRVSHNVGKLELAKAIGDDRTDNVDNAITGKTTPRLHLALNSLLADNTALFNTFQLFGGCFVPTKAASQCDMTTISAMLHAATEYLDRMKDNKRCHVDTAELAKLFIPLVPAMLAIIEEAQQ